EQDILENIGMKRKSAGRTLLGIALPIARDLVGQIRKIKGVKKVEIAGSIRRMKATIGDIDILAIAGPSVINAFTKLNSVKRVLVKGPTKASVILDSGMQADLRVLPEKSFGAGLQYFTGNKDHNVALRKIAIKKKYKLSEYGLFRNDKYVCGRTEKEIYAKLGLPFIPPELRQNKGELENPVPNLVKLSDIKGDLQMHSKFSDGNNTILEMAKKCESMGYKYMAITDHSQSEHIAGGMDLKKLRKYLKEIDAVRKKVKIKILKGAEVDILSDGALDYPDKVLKELDIVLVAIHRGFKQPVKKMTDRICKALQNPHVNILVHPTGGVIGERRPYAVDLERVAEVAKKNKVALEIDSFPSRLDLNDENARLVLKKGCRLSIDTDSHSVDQLWAVDLGVGQARRAGAESKDIINTWPLSKLEKFLRKK
ncbi:PHP domain-containing protein, partial [Candidatus Woesearchaeota archaeon]|nr:PHP domain-containing protein [Candidatus Woesearchaeota archaeon]